MARGMKKVASGKVQGTGGKEPALFRRSVWKGGQMNYECGMCAYATLEPMKMAAHLRVTHGIQGGTAPVDDGSPIILVEKDEVKE
jgi:hypothetical protein